jgi:hypothetical protein
VGGTRSGGDASVMTSSFVMVNPFRYPAQAARERVQRVDRSHLVEMFEQVRGVVSPEQYQNGACDNVYLFNITAFGKAAPNPYLHLNM